MAVTVDQVAALRAYVAGDFEEHKRLHGQLDRNAVKTGYMALIAAAFFEAAYRRFGSDVKSADIVAFVGDVRGRSERLEKELTLGSESV